jgi:hypothetical protein
MLPAVNGANGTGEGGLHQMHIWQITAAIAVDRHSDRSMVALLNISTIEVTYGNRQF